MSKAAFPSSSVSITATGRYSAPFKTSKVNGAWKFLGACEPEERLNQGWFVNASSRAILVHARNFSAFQASSEAGEATDRTGWHREGELPCYQNVTAGYARTRKIRITVTEPDGSPAKAARVFFEVLNGAEYRPVAGCFFRRVKINI